MGFTAIDKEGKRRLDDPADCVRLEIEAAMAREVRVIPILVEGATMPAADQVPRGASRRADAVVEFSTKVVGSRADTAL